MPSRPLLFLALCLAGSRASAQVQSDGTPSPCLRDSDCGICGWVCDPTMGTCVLAPRSAGTCTSSSDCACPGQTCDGGAGGDAGLFCVPTFQPQCLCDSDCPAGQICNSWTNSCQAPTSGSCTYSGQCDCGSFCLTGACFTAIDGGCSFYPRVCLSSISDGGFVGWDAGFSQFFDGGLTFPDGGVDAGILVGGIYCQQIGGSCSADSQCCSRDCYQGACTCVAGSDPGEYACLVDGDCCSPAVCDATKHCYLDAGNWAPISTSSSGDFAAGTSSGPKNPLSCASAPADESGVLLLAAFAALAATSLRRRTR